MRINRELQVLERENIVSLNWHRPWSRPLSLSIISIGFLVLLSSCQTSQAKGFESVAEGMEKDAVIEAAGSPTISRRWRGKDRWIYIFKNKSDEPTVREIHFHNGKAVYVGDALLADVSAEEQDQINNDNNAAEDKRLSQSRSQWEEEMGVARAQPNMSSPETETFRPAKKMDRIDRYIRDSYSGTINIEEEKKKRAPVFRPVN